MASEPGTKALEEFKAVNERQQETLHFSLLVASQSTFWTALVKGDRYEKIILTHVNARDGAPAAYQIQACFAIYVRPTITGISRP